MLELVSDVRLNSSQVSLLNALTDDLVNQHLPFQLADEDDWADCLERFNEDDVLRVLNDVWLNSKYNKLIINKVIEVDKEDPENLSELYDSVYREINAGSTN